MFRARIARAGILFAIAAAGTISCGESKFTQPNPKSEIIAVQGFERFLNSSQRESRELLVDGRVTNIEWDLTGNPSVILMEGGAGGGGNYYVLARSLWTLNEFGGTDAFYLLLQWPDRTEDRLQEPLVTSADAFSDVGDTLIYCQTDDSLVRESSWSRSDLQEDQLWIEMYSDSLGSYPADVWRWGAETTDPCTPVNGAEFVGAVTDGDTLGSTQHPGAGFLEDMYDAGGGPIRDAAVAPGHLSPAKWTYMDTNHNPGSNVPLRIASKGTRDSRLNRAKPTHYVLWASVDKPMGPCEYNNPIREDDAGVRDKTWNPNDYVPSFSLGLPSDSQLDVIGKGQWLAGKWALEVRRDLVARPPDVGGLPQTPWPDDIPLVPGRRYLMRITIYDGATKTTSRSPLTPIYLRP